ncbi:hypothetical protein H7X46_00575 [Pseudonocardia sp. C8]|uniref:hypothetical protein n=1 Tax=Pseudonocardia sp. C8 TaxID=2762759 RepID=UPI001642D803|nr:hypothetical protein [Pseudonocardia sp. C8]MBC3189560.1 hypothetical protein [Pseudonocardia sp. C8]
MTRWIERGCRGEQRWLGLQRHDDVIAFGNEGHRRAATLTVKTPFTEPEARTSAVCSPSAGGGPIAALLGRCHLPDQVLRASDGYVAMAAGNDGLWPSSDATGIVPGAPSPPAPLDPDRDGALSRRDRQTAKPGALIEQMFGYWLPSRVTRAGSQPIHAPLSVPVSTINLLRAHVSASTGEVAHVAKFVRHGRFGETHVEPTVLFDGTDPAAAPPPDAHDVQFRAPVSLSVMLDGMAEADLDHEVAAWGRAYSELLTGLLREIQRSCGWVVDPAAPAVLVPGRLALAAVVEPHVPGFAQARWHGHVYVGATAPVLATGELSTVPGDWLQEGIFSMQSEHLNAVEDLAEREFGVTWGKAQLGAAKREIVEPPWHEYIGDDDRGVCPGPWPTTGARVLADERFLRLSAEAEATTRADLESGRYDPRPDWRVAREFWLSAFTR